MSYFNKITQIFQPALTKGKTADFLLSNNNDFLSVRGFQRFFLNLSLTNMIIFYQGEVARHRPRLHPGGSSISLSQSQSTSVALWSRLVPFFPLPLQLFPFSVLFSRHRRRPRSLLAVSSLGGEANRPSWNRQRKEGKEGRMTLIGSSIRPPTPPTEEANCGRPSSVLPSFQSQSWQLQQQQPFIPPLAVCHSS